jgi:hypothetical protein
LRDRSPILEIDPHGEIIPIDVERDVDILRGGRYGRIMKAIDFAACQDEATIGVYFARSSGPIPNANCAEFILVGSLRHIVPIGPRRPVERAREIKALLKSRFQTAMCEVAHTSVDTGKILQTPARLRRGDSPCYGRA